MNRFIKLVKFGFVPAAMLLGIQFAAAQVGGPWWNTQWHYRLPVASAANGFTRTNKVVDFPVNFTTLLSSLGVSSALNDQSVRVIEVDGSGNVTNSNVVFQFDHDPTYNASTNASGTVVVMMAGTTSSGTTRYFHIYFDTGTGFTLPSFSNQVTLTDNVFFQGQSSYQINNELGSLWYHKVGGGFAGMRDLNSTEWIGYQPCCQGGGEYRGIPNMGEYAHPGYNDGSSTILSQGPLKITIQTVTTDGTNARWTWAFYPRYQTMTLHQTGVNYWLLYEGIPYGTLDQTNGFIKTSAGQTLNLGSSFAADLPGPEWVYFGQTGQPRFLFLAHHENDNLIDHYRPFPGPMTVFGFGRDGGSVDKYLSQVPMHLTFGFGENESQSAGIMDNAFRDLSIAFGSPEANVSGPAQITGQPADKTVEVGQTATFNVTAVGAPTLIYRWQRNNVDIGGATSSSYTTPITIQTDSGATFRCIVNNSLGTATSNPALLRVIPGPPPPSSSITTDYFNSTELNLAVWVVDDTVGDGTQTMNSTQLSLAVPSGTSHDLYTNENKALRVLQPITNITNFSVEAKFDSPMNAAYQLEGIVVEQNASNLLRFGFHTDGASIILGAYSISSNVATLRLGGGTIGAAGIAPLYLRVSRATDTWTMMYSIDGLDWTSAGSFVHSLTSTAIGPFAGNAGGSPPAFSGLVDYFVNLDDPLPVQLASFTAMIQQNEIRLDWTTVSETNNYGFEVQKSFGSTNNYQTIPNSFVAGHGTTLEPHHYTFTDAISGIGSWFYRLKQIDLDGTAHFTEPVQVNTVTSVQEGRTPTEFSLMQNYPNPFNPATNISYALPKETHVKLEVYDIMGRRVANLVGQKQGAGFYTVPFDASGLGSGIYFYKLTTNETSFTKKLMLLR